MIRLCYTQLLQKKNSTKDQFVVENCMTYFVCPFVSEAVKKRKRKFLEKFLVSQNFLWELFTDKATSELSLHTQMRLFTTFSVSAMVVYTLHVI